MKTGHRCKQINTDKGLNSLSLVVYWRITPANISSAHKTLQRLARRTAFGAVLDPPLRITMHLWPPPQIFKLTLGGFAFCAFGSRFNRHQQRFSMLLHLQLLNLLAGPRKDPKTWQ